MICSSLFPAALLNTGEFKTDFISSVVIMLMLLRCQVSSFYLGQLVLFHIFVNLYCLF